MLVVLPLTQILLQLQSWLAKNINQESYPGRNITEDRSDNLKFRNE